MVKYYCSHKFYMKYYTIRKTFFIPSYTINKKEAEQIDKFIELIDKSGVCEILKTDEKSKEKGGRPTYNPYDMLALILYSFMIGKRSLRDIEDFCSYDLRGIYIMENENPTYKSIGNYINENIGANREKIFSKITSQIFKECNLKMDKAYIDGSKFEADSNKYKFVWKPKKHHKNLSEKIRMTLEKYGLSKGIPKNENIESRILAEKITEFYERYKDIDYSKKENKEIKKTYQNLLEWLNKSLEYEEKERTCGQRNSYYKSDKDATAMTLKQDYYSGLGSNMHAAYNIQLCVMNGLITSYLVTQSRDDMHDFTRILDKQYEMYEKYPEATCADAGYGSIENYIYLEEHGIINYVKYFNWEGNVSGRNPSQYHLNKDETITCLNGNIGYKAEDIDWHHKKANSTFYRITGCNSCEFRLYCKRMMNNKDEDFKTFEVVIQLQKYIEQSYENLLSPKGIEMRVNRSSQVEGAFGVIKQDMQFTRFQRTSLDKVTTEFMLVCLGYNLKKLFKYYNGKGKFEYWKAPLNLQSERMKKPSAKRLTNKVIKKKNKSVNQKAKDSYKHSYSK